MVVTAVVVIERGAAGGGPVFPGNRFQGFLGALGPQATADPFGRLSQSGSPLVAVHLHQLVHPFPEVALNLQHRGLLHLIEKGLGNAAAAHLDAFRFQPDGCGPTALVLIQGLSQLVFVVLGAGLIRQTQTAETAAAVVGQPFQINHGCTARGHGQQQIGFPRSRSASHHAKGPDLLKAALGPAPIALVAPLKEPWLEIDLLGKPGHAGRSHSAPPAVDPWFPLLPQVVQLAGQAAELGAGEFKPQVNRWCASLLLVSGAHCGTFLIVEQRHVDGAGPVPLFKFAGAANVHQWTFQLAKLLDLD